MTARILVTGSRDWTDARTISDALWAQLRIHRGIIVVHGACPTGADAIADRWAQMWANAGVAVERHPAAWDVHGKAAGPIRNQHMINLGVDVCLAFPLPQSRGTIHCIERAHRAAIPVIVHQPIGNQHSAHDTHVQP